MAADAVIFDLDGTVWDSAAWFSVALSGGDPSAAAAIRNELIAGGNIVRALKRVGMSRERLLVEAQRMSGPPPLFADISEALESLAEAGTPLAVATSLPGTIAMPMLDAAGLGGQFAAVIHAGICRVSKPHPRSLLMAAGALGLEPGPGVFYVGDRSVDREAANRAGISPIWIAHGYESPPHRSGVATLTPLELLAL